MSAVDEVRHVADSDAEFRKALLSGGEAVTEVATDPQVFERITLGLYREPASALRELISNAYDADASKVTITTDQPYFNEIRVADDGSGMSAAAIDHLIHNVGGSLKRTEAGVKAGVAKRIGESPGGRKLIGQMGIGLYSIARLTRRFTIETKQEDAKHRFVLEVDLSGLDKENPPEEGAERYVAGYARLLRFAVSEWEFKDHGTTVTLHNILPEARNILQSRDRWQNRLSSGTKEAKGELHYHIGFPEAKQPPELPWKALPAKATPREKFRSFVDALSTKAEAAHSSPSLSVTLDYYLAMLWKISLAAPLRYVDKAPFELTADDGVDFYDLSGNETPKLIALPEGMQIGQLLDYHEEGSPTPFIVVVDGIELRRPILFRAFGDDKRKLIERPKMFLGRFDSVFEGADLAGVAYFFWSYEIIPKENNGILVRIAGASGELFDARFLNFRTSENLRLRQVSAEAFVTRGYDTAINVDRESYVETDPNVRALQRWTHRSMTRIFTRLKFDQRTVATERKDEEESAVVEQTESYSQSVWKKKRRGEGPPPTVVVSSRQTPPADLPDEAIFVGSIESKRRGGVEKEFVFSSRLRAIVRILDAYHLLDELSGRERSDLINQIAAVLDKK